MNTASFILTTSDTLTVTLSTAPATTQPSLIAFYVDKTSDTSETLGNSGLVTCNGTTSVTVLSAPSTGVRIVSSVYLKNLDTESVTVNLLIGSAVPVTMIVASGTTVNLLGGVDVNAVYLEGLIAAETERAEDVEATKAALAGSSSQDFAAAILSANGIKFPSTPIATSDANTLNSWEYGDWTPTLSATTTAPTGVTYTYQSGKYYKIGNLVILFYVIILSSYGTGGAGVVLIEGMPYTGNTSLGGIFAFHNMYYQANTTSSAPSSFCYSHNYITTSNAYSSVTNTGSFRGCFIYFTN